MYYKHWTAESSMCKSPTFLINDYVIQHRTAMPCLRWRFWVSVSPKVKNKEKTKGCNASSSLEATTRGAHMSHEHHSNMWRKPSADSRAWPRYGYCALTGQIFCGVGGQFTNILTKRQFCPAVQQQDLIPNYLRLPFRLPIIEHKCKDK